jgi:hypothetical protein
LGGPGYAPKPAIDTGSGLAFGPDCSSVTVGPAFWSAAQAQASQLVAQGYGLPVFPLSLAGRSVDAVIRTIVATHAGTACIDSAPWLDRYAAGNPPPTWGPHMTLAQYQAASLAWDDAWEAKISTWAAAHPAAFKFFRDLGREIVARWAAANGLQQALQAPQAGAAGTLPPMATSADGAALRALGYDLDATAGERFQSDWNTFGIYLYGPEWAASKGYLEVDGKVGPLTRQGLAVALTVQQARGPWPFVVGVARAA